MRKQITILLIIHFQLSIFNCYTQPIWKVSGAPIGDTSVYLYPTGGWLSTHTLTLSYPLTQDSFKVQNVAGTPDGIHIYGINKIPNAICNINSIRNKPYYGVFVVNGTSPSYEVVYYYGGNPNVTPAIEPQLVLYNRPTNADTACIAWNNILGTLNLTANTLTNGTFGGNVTFWSENFATGCSQNNNAHNTTTANGTWTVTTTGTNDPQANEFYISATEAGMGAGNCGDGCLNNAGLTNRSLHIANIAGSPAGVLCSIGDCGAAYDATVTTNKRAESPTINCSGKTNITISFNYFMYGEDPTPGTGADLAYLAYFDGSTWTDLVALPQTTCCDASGNVIPCTGTIGEQGHWASYSYTLPASANNNPNVKIGFRWTNDNNNQGSDPSFAVDDIQLSAPIGLRNEFILGKLSTPLPVTLNNFSISCNKNNKIIAWETITEINADYFVLEKSYNGIDFNTFATIPAHGNSNESHQYSITDNDTTTLIYYKLLEIDFNGTPHLYVIDNVVCSGNDNTNLFIFPNPAINTLTINNIQSGHLNIYNSLGEVVLNRNISEKESHQINLNISHLAAGIYFVRFTDNKHEVQTFKLIIQNK